MLGRRVGIGFSLGFSFMEIHTPYDTLCTGRPFLYWEGSWVAKLSLVCLDSRTKLHLAQTLCSFCGLSQVRGRVRALTLYIVEGRAAGGEARPRSTGQQEAPFAKACSAQRVCHPRACVGAGGGGVGGGGGWCGESWLSRAARRHAAGSDWPGRFPAEPGRRSQVERGPAPNAGIGFGVCPLKVV